MILQILTIIILISYIIYKEIKDRKMASAKLQEYADRLNAAGLVLDEKISAINVNLQNSVNEQEIQQILEAPVSSLEAKINAINPEQ